MENSLSPIVKILFIIFSHSLKAKAYIFNAFSVKGDFDTTVTLSIKGTYRSQSSNTVEPLPSLFFNVVLDKCSVGQMSDSSKSM